MAKAIRRHWSVENELHWVLDVTFREDAISLKDPDGAAQMALFNRIALSVIKQNTSIKDSQAAKRRRAIWSGEFRPDCWLTRAQAIRAFFRAETQYVIETLALPDQCR